MCEAEYFFVPEEMVCSWCDASGGLGEILSKPTFIVIMIALSCAIVGGCVVAMCRGHNQWLEDDDGELDAAMQDPSASKQRRSSIKKRRPSVQATEKKSKAEATKAKKSLALLKKKYATMASKVKMNKDGSVTFTEVNESKAPPHLKTLVEVTATSAVNITVITKVVSGPKNSWSAC